MSIFKSQTDREKRLEIFHAMSLDLIGIDDEEDVLWYVAHEVVGKLNFVDCVIYSFVEHAGKLVQRAAVGPKSPKKKVLVDPIGVMVGSGIVGNVAANRAPKVVPDVSKEKGYISDLDFKGSELAVPIIHNNLLYGVIDSEHPQISYFTSADLEDMQKIAQLLGAKLHQIEMHKLVHQQASILEEIMDVVAITDEKGLVTYVNPAAAKVYKYSSNHLHNLAVSDLVVVEGEYDVWRNELRQSIQDNGAWRGPLRIRKGDGTIGNFEAIIKEMFDSKGNFIGILSVSRDTSDTQKLD